MSPMYDYSCCDSEWENAHKIEDRNNETCGKCGGKAKLIIKNKAKPIVLDYFSENLNARVTGRAQKSKLMKKLCLEECG